MNKLIQSPVRRIFRAEHGRACPYVKTAKQAVDDKTLELAALGLLTVLLSKPDHWDIDPEQIARERGIGIGQARRLLNVLVAAGYLVAPVRGKNAKTGRWEYTGYLLRELPGIAVPVLRNPSHGAPPPADRPADKNENQAQNPGIKEFIANTDSVTTDQQQHHTDTGADDDVHEPEFETGEIISEGEDRDPTITMQDGGQLAGTLLPSEPVTAPPPVSAPSPTPAAALLEAAGVDTPLRDVLANRHAPGDIEKAIAYTGQNATENPAGFLVKCLLYGWHRKAAAPAGRAGYIIDRQTGERYVPGQYDEYLQT